jgi:hypothetical protein
MSTPLGWTKAEAGVWERRQPGCGGEFGILLRAWADPLNPAEPWGWEVVEVAAEDDAEVEVDVGSAESQEEAMEAARARAAAYLGTGE